MLMRRDYQFTSLLLVLLCAITLGAQGRPGQQSQMVLLGTTRVNMGADQDTVRVGKQAGTFRAIQLRVNGGAVNFQRVVVQYGNGTRDQIQVRSNIPAGGKTRIIDLPGDRRIIQRVDFWYSKAHWLTRPTVSLYGVR
ncbi:MAG TPA: hypothetical protein VGR97_14690 [Candidatus Acidoferrales bacterium]|nr:hypothetical protein [Candidatus Acidoferrales bacterium]